ncbi:MAG: type II secretion system F family protein [Roseibium sp.]|uniref:type II secretion system F family protein n=1 Tax=Roseibium sp. TaxID=1936156 RepID=UPI003299FDFB
MAALNPAERVIAKLQFGYKNRMAFYQQIIALNRAGMAKTDAIEMAWQVASQEGRKPKEGLALVLTDVLNSMRNGMTMGKAIQPWVPGEDTMVLEAIENSDDFAGNLQEYCEMSDKKKKIRSTILGGLVYPVMLLSAIYGMMIYFGKTIVPQIGQVLPVETWTGAGAFLAFMADFANNYAWKATIGVILFFALIIFSMPRWSKYGRVFADKLPLYSTYRMYTGIGFLMSMASLLKGGMPAMDALDRLRPYTNPYVKHRLNLLRRNMLNGHNFGSALYRTGTGWPDTKMNLSIKIFAETQDLSRQMSNLAKSWIDQAQSNVEKSMAVMQNVALIAVFGGVIAIVAGMYSIQGQIAQSTQAF